MELLVTSLGPVACGLTVFFWEPHHLIYTMKKVRWVVSLLSSLPVVCGSLSSRIFLSQIHPLYLTLEHHRVSGIDGTFQSLSLNHSTLEQPPALCPPSPASLFPAVKLLSASFYPLALSHDHKRELFVIADSEGSKKRKTAESQICG